MQKQPQFQVGDQVQVEVIRQQSSRSRRNGHIASVKVMEIGSIQYREEDYYIGEHLHLPAGWEYRLRRPGGKGKGGQVIHAENSLQLAK